MVVSEAILACEHMALGDQRTQTFQSSLIVYINFVNLNNPWICLNGGFLIGGIPVLQWST